MPEAEELIADAARHATVFAQELWRRRRRSQDADRIRLADIAVRLDLLITAVFPRQWSLRASAPPAPPTLLRRLGPDRGSPTARRAVPATDGSTIWLPDDLDIGDPTVALQRFRAMAMQQAMRAVRRAPAASVEAGDEWTGALHLLIEAHAAEAHLARLLPGLLPDLRALRQHAFAVRPPLTSFPAAMRPLEGLVRTALALAPGERTEVFVLTGSGEESLHRAERLGAAMQGSAPKALGRLFRDWWTGELKRPAMPTVSEDRASTMPAEIQALPSRSARLHRAPRVRAPEENEEDATPGAWMIQTSQPQEHAEDPIGMHRPTDRDEQSAAEDFADSLSELPEARLVCAPGRPKEFLLSEERVDLRPSRSAETVRGEAALAYPEWDWRSRSYRLPGALVHRLPPLLGSADWVRRTLDAHRATLEGIRRRFELLRAQRMRLRKQFDGEEVDLDAYIDRYADFRAGCAMLESVYQTMRVTRREMALALLIDVSGSTDAWVNAHRRIIDVEREALLLVCVALDGLGEPYAVHAFSGEGPNAVTVRQIKGFDEAHDFETRRRIAALEPERYTRAGAAIRHVTAELMRQGARHRLLLVLSDGKPNDVDEYEGRYGVEDMRQAVTEARLQGILPFCLTIDRQAPGYLAQIFGAGQYALLPRPELLASVLLDWLKRLVVS